MKITNRSGDAHDYRMTFDGVADAGPPNLVSIVAPENPLTVKPGETRTTSVFVVLPRSSFTAGERAITIVVSDGAGYTERDPYRLLGPSTGGVR